MSLFSWQSPYNLKHLQPLFPGGSGICPCLRYVVSRSSSPSRIRVCEVAEEFEVLFFRNRTWKCNFNSSHEGTFVVYCLFPAGSSDSYTKIYTTMLTSTNILHLPPSWGSAQIPVSPAKSSLLSLESASNFILLLKRNSIFPVFTQQLWIPLSGHQLSTDSGLLRSSTTGHYQLSWQQGWGIEKVISACADPQILGQRARAGDSWSTVCVTSHLNHPGFQKLLPELQLCCFLGKSRFLSPFFTWHSLSRCPEFILKVSKPCKEEFGK